MNPNWPPGDSDKLFSRVQLCSLPSVEHSLKIPCCIDLRKICIICFNEHQVWPQVLLPGKGEPSFIWINSHHFSLRPLTVSRQSRKVAVPQPKSRTFIFFASESCSISSLPCSISSLPCSISSLTSQSKLLQALQRSLQGLPSPTSSTLLYWRSRSSSSCSQWA